MKKYRWQIVLGLVLVVASTVFYFIHYLVFHDPHHIFIYLIGDIAFVPFEVLLVSLIIHKVLSEREKRNLLKKMNMVIGAFFSEVGTGLLKMLLERDPNKEKEGTGLTEIGNWRLEDFGKRAKQIKSQDFHVEYDADSFSALKKYIVSRKQFLLGLLENANLLEHETFTDLLWSVFHLAEELECRVSFDNLPQTDSDHLVGDANRSYSLIVREWIHYMGHLKEQYPYLFSLAVRTNPFNPEASAVVGLG